MKMPTTFLLILAMLAAPSAAGAQSIGPRSTWANDHGSVLVIQSVAPDGRLTGTYSSSQPDYPCRNIAFPLVGWVAGDTIAYAMRAKSESKDCGTITSWTGALRDGKLYAEWSLATIDPQSKKPVLSHGTDIYHRK
ncbi:MAG: avidin/streptavidin family protein [Reyranella sp.]|nr:avidin/streptavidin family protein [Reyranella sp.]